ncbi:MAG: hypothetical protein HY263_03130 [Chloroflexi bacterium]|nr:hypothetical protein [Chloroflexota bacterium]
MRINRALLYSGTFLVAIGAVLVVVDQGVLATSTVSDALRYWPLAVLAIGAGLVFRHTQVSLASGLIAAAMPGLLLGGAFAVAPRISGDCGLQGQPAAEMSRGGELGQFSAPGSVSLTLDCGSLNVGTADGTAWHLNSTGGRDPLLSLVEGNLAVESANGRGFDALRDGRSTWDLTLPRTDIAELALVLNLGHAQLNLFEANVARLALTTNAGDVHVDATGSRLGEVTAKVNLGVLSIDLPAFADVHGSFEVNAGGIKVCTPTELGVRVVTRDVATQVTVQGLKQAGSIWESANYTSAEHRADLDITGSFGAVDINPIGGCK